MRIIHNFSSKKHVKDFPIIDILIGYVGLYNLRTFGYDVKLYCEPKDFEFLKSGGLYDLYTEIDDSFLSNNELINGTSINGENFGSIRKIECINHEFEISKEPFIYMDTDIILNEPLEITDDISLLVGSPESQEKIYIPWTHLSLPKGYVMPEYIFKTEGAYNCGILYFKNKFLFKDYRRHYLNFTINNPCETRGVTAWSETIRNIGACNAEQRILKAIAEYKHGNVSYIMNVQAPGACDKGIHYYFLRGFGRLLTMEDFLNEEDKKYGTFILNTQLQQLLDVIANIDRELLLKLLKIDGVKDFYENKIQITEYK